jgi:hypothetical protein
MERNALLASLCDQAEDWNYGSLWRQIHLSLTLRSRGRPRKTGLLTCGPFVLPIAGVGIGTTL